MEKFHSFCPSCKKAFPVQALENINSVGNCCFCDYSLKDEEVNKEIKPKIEKIKIEIEEDNKKSKKDKKKEYNW